ncbi:MAG: ATP-grasp domain-containing protein [Longimicrobiaceae bacterium]
MPVKRCAFLTMDSLDGFFSYDELLYEPLRLLGWSVEPIPWRRTAVEWDAYEAVVIRTPWDYQQDPSGFLAVLEQIEDSSTRLLNPLELVRWNIDKRYLLDLADSGVMIVPTVLDRGLDAERLQGLFDRLGADRIVVKPTIGANATDALPLSRKADGEAWAGAIRAFADRPYLAQPFVRSVVEVGEYSLCFFGGKYSHAVLKKPKAGDFRVQEEHGGLIRAVDPEPALLASAAKAVAAVSPTPLYARADLVRLAAGEWATMELEVIEPSLYFSFDAASPERFASVFDGWMTADRT